MKLSNAFFLIFATIIVDVIDCQKESLSFATTRAQLAVDRENLVPESNDPCALFRETVLAMDSILALRLSSIMSLALVRLAPPPNIIVHTRPAVAVVIPTFHHLTELGDGFFDSAFSACFSHAKDLSGSGISLARHFLKAGQVLTPKGQFL